MNELVVTDIRNPLAPGVRWVRLAARSSELIKLSAIEVAILVALYDRMGAATLDVEVMETQDFMRIEAASDRLLDLYLIEAARQERRAAVDIALTDSGMVLANELQKNYDRRTAPKLGLDPYENDTRTLQLIDPARNDGADSQELVSKKPA